MESRTEANDGMQAKLGDFAREKKANKWNIDEADLNNLISKFCRQEKVSQREPLKVNSEEDYFGMPKREWPTPNESSTKQKESTSHEKSECLSMNDKLDHCEDIEENSGLPDPDRTSPGEVQSFVQKKNMAQGMMDLALVSANCNQLRYVLDSRAVHPYFLTSLILIISSLAMQVVVGIVLLYSNRYNLKKHSEMKAADNCSHFGIYGVFLITLINFLIAAFSGTHTVTLPSSDDPNCQEPVP